jgi:MFS family permease
MNPKMNSSLLSEFQSLLMEWNEHCQHSSLVIITSTIVMLGAVVGAFCSGFLADRFGRKPVVVGMTNTHL